jgi:hypothetical protein
MTTKSSHLCYTAFAASVASMEPEISCFLATGAPTSTLAVVTDNEDSDDEGSDCESTQSTSDGTQDDTVNPVTTARTGTTSPATNAPPTQVNFKAHPEVQGMSIKNNEPLNKDKDELYRFHVRAGHLSLSKIRAMARLGEVPKRLATCDSPMCAACEFGKATHKPWRTKATSRNVRPASAPVESRDVGFVAQLKGRLTKGRY